MSPWEYLKPVTCQEKTKQGVVHQAAVPLKTAGGRFQSAFKCSTLTRWNVVALTISCQASTLKSSFWWLIMSVYNLIHIICSHFLTLSQQNDNEKSVILVHFTFDLHGQGSTHTHARTQGRAKMQHIRNISEKLCCVINEKLASTAKCIGHYINYTQTPPPCEVNEGRRTGKRHSIHPPSNRGASWAALKRLSKQLP